MVNEQLLAAFDHDQIWSPLGINFTVIMSYKILFYKKLSLEEKIGATTITYFLRYIPLVISDTADYEEFSTKKELFLSHTVKDTDTALDSVAEILANMSLDSETNRRRLRYILELHCPP